MDEIQIFESPEFGAIETIMIEDKPILRLLIYVNVWATRNLIVQKRHIHSDDSLFRGVIDSLGREQQTLFINESGLYSLILRSKRKEAESFQRWVTSDLLPTLRKTGRYELEQQALANELHHKHLLQRIKEAEKDAAFSKDMLCMGAELDVKRKVSDVTLYSATEIAKGLSCSTQYFNKRLAEMGIIKKEFSIWVIVEKYRPYGYAKLDERSYPDRYRGYYVKVQLMKWTLEGVKFVISMWTGMEEDEVNKSVILSNIIYQNELNLIAKAKAKNKIMITKATRTLD